jgi:hypothetical protein
MITSKFLVHQNKKKKKTQIVHLPAYKNKKKKKYTQY